jgi:hypothetical protein
MNGTKIIRMAPLKKRSHSLTLHIKNDSLFNKADLSHFCSVANGYLNKILTVGKV